MKNAYDVILAPVITEASMDGVANKKYTFRVASDATKADIKTAVETAFKVEVKSVNTITMKKKPKTVGRYAGYTGEWKKAIVTLTADSKTIEFFDGLM